MPQRSHRRSSLSHASRSSMPTHSDDNGRGSGLESGLTVRRLEAFSRTVTATASHLMGDHSPNNYLNAMPDPSLQRKFLSLAKTAPKNIVRSNLMTTELQKRALSYVPDECLKAIPQDTNSYSLFNGFHASMTDSAIDKELKDARRARRTCHKQLTSGDQTDRATLDAIAPVRSQRDALARKMELMNIRKNMCSADVKDIDRKISNLQNMRKIVMDRLADLEMNEAEVEQELNQLENQLNEAEDEGVLVSLNGASSVDSPQDSEKTPDSQSTSESYDKLSPPGSPPKAFRQKSSRKRSAPIRHEHFEPGTAIGQIKAHDDEITAIDFDAPFGTMVSTALDDVLRVWDLNHGISIGNLEGHHASVRCLQMEDGLLATGSMDASIRLWDLSRAQYFSHNNGTNVHGDDDSKDAIAPLPFDAPRANMDECQLFSLEAHLNEVTALHFKGETLVSGSADKTLRQWDLVTGRCVQTLDVLWAAAQSSSLLSKQNHYSSSRMNDNANFVGALQCFDAALACGTADGVIRLWDLRSGQVHRSLVGHTAPVTALQFDDQHIVTGSLDRSIRIWDLRTGSIVDVYAYDNPVTSMMFDHRRIVAAAGENVVKVYDKADATQWDCGMLSKPTESGSDADIVEKVKIRDGYMTEGRRNGAIGIWAC